MLKKIDVLQIFLSHRYYSNLIIAILDNTQLAVGITTSILIYKEIFTKHVSSVWIFQLIGYLQYYQIKLQIPSVMKILNDKYNDRSLIENVTQDYSLILTHKILSACRFFLQVTFLSNICNNIGTKLHEESLTNNQNQKKVANITCQFRLNPTRNTGISRYNI